MRRGSLWHPGMRMWREPTEWNMPRTQNKALHLDRKPSFVLSRRNKYLARIANRKWHNGIVEVYCESFYCSAKTIILMWSLETGAHVSVDSYSRTLSKSSTKRNQLSDSNVHCRYSPRNAAQPLKSIILCPTIICATITKLHSSPGRWLVSPNGRCDLGPYVLHSKLPYT